MVDLINDSKSDDSILDLREKMLCLLIEEKGLKLKDPLAVKKFFSNDKSINEADVQAIIAALKTMCMVMRDFVCPIVDKL